jgi:hypothetical protein
MSIHAEDSLVFGDDTTQEQMAVLYEKFSGEHNDFQECSEAGGDNIGLTPTVSMPIDDLKNALDQQSNTLEELAKLAGFEPDAAQEKKRRKIESDKSAGSSTGGPEFPGFAYSAEYVCNTANSPSVPPEAPLAKYYIPFETLETFCKLKSDKKFKLLQFHSLQESVQKKFLTKVLEYYVKNPGPIETTFELEIKVLALSLIIQVLRSSVLVHVRI